MKQRNSKGQFIKGICYNPDTQFKKGFIPWNKGKSGYTTKPCSEERKRKIGFKNSTHNLTHTRFYNIWATMKNRCYNPKQIGYYYYGNRGISVCNHWLNFSNFLNDMYQSYQQHIQNFGEKQTTIDRINPYGNYELSNCRWATYKEQRHNRRI